ncbi:VanZ family protein [Nocardioides rotundus]|uniref:VanZ family protein n=1 Tax=Nocardioides rotundus TaxID=1774216 RepID=UPI001CBD2D36|nr:VanZ family protein [Nocardioides rotundus]UAL29172.1 VanZ family protein [Nocardioides rotundus]
MRGRLLLALVAASLVVLGCVVFQATGSLPTRVVSAVTEQLLAIGVSPTLAESSRVEFALNVAMFVPPVAVAALLLPRIRWSEWVVIAFVVSGVVELVQGFLLPDRSATFSDVVANTLGGLIGALAVSATRRVSSRS